MASSAEIEIFLKDFKVKLGIWGLLIQGRLNQKNFKTMTELEFQMENVKSILRELKCEDYCEGPLPDLLYKGADMWVFGKEIKSREVYIKITLGSASDKVICISFHFAEHTLKYPYKKHVS